ncbi:MAG: hypothetical protein CME26_01260 [Gemmatimonadetes bacterium]|nr:hypothetical protein [Gemmatimonadota bacterium]|tara:strand:+ start:7116 stop:7667 length:552 start_codon:yes stop_codon:yes gene_type:complete
MRRVKLLRVDTYEPVFLTVAEGERLIAAAEGQMCTLLTLALHTGLRRMELFNLQWADVDMEREEIVVRRAKSRKYRRVPVNSVVVAALRGHPRHIRSSHVFHREDGGPWRDVRKRLWAALDKAGLPRVRLHDLRHSFASNLVAAGVDLRNVKELVGHSSLEMTLRYSHLTPGRLRASVAALEG